MILRRIATGTSWLVLIGILCATGFAALPLFPFYEYPPIVSLFLERRCEKVIPRVFFAVASLGYGIWFAYLYYNALYVHLDPQSGLVLLFVGIYAFPVVALLWTIAFIFEKYVAEGVP